MDRLLYQAPDDLPRILTITAHLLRFLLAGFFILMATKNLAGNEQMAADFTRWGYPDWFRVMTACLQITGALVLLAPAFSFYGAILLCCVLIGATLTRFHYDGAGPALVPFAFLTITTMLVLWYRPGFFRHV